MTEKGNPGEASELILGLPQALLEHISGSLEEAILGGRLCVFLMFLGLSQSSPEIIGNQLQARSDHRKKLCIHLSED